MTMRSAYWVLWAIRDPPNPRLMTGTPGKSSASVFHRRMLELPTNSTPPGAGGFSASAASKARMSFSNGAGLVAGACATVRVEAQRRATANRNAIAGVRWLTGNAVPVRPARRNPARARAAGPRGGMSKYACPWPAPGVAPMGGVHGHGRPIIWEAKLGRRKLSLKDHNGRRVG